MSRNHYFTRTGPLPGLHRFHPEHSETLSLGGQVLLNMDGFYLEKWFHSLSLSLSPVAQFLCLAKIILARTTYVTVPAMPLGVWLEPELGLWDMGIAQAAI